jgi:hypothetical protein
MTFSLLAAEAPEMSAVLHICRMPIPIEFVRRDLAHQGVLGALEFSLGHSA